jgi:hypothetical protein
MQFMGNRLGGCFGKDKGLLAPQHRELTVVAAIQGRDRRRSSTSSQRSSAAAVLRVPSPRKACLAGPAAKQGLKTLRDESIKPN